MLFHAQAMTDTVISMQTMFQKLERQDDPVHFPVTWLGNEVVCFDVL